MEGVREGAIEGVMEGAMEGVMEGVMSVTNYVVEFCYFTLHLLLLGDVRKPRPRCFIS